MKKVAVTALVLALGLAACAKSNDANNEMTANESYSENAAATDVNESMNAEAAASNALENGVNTVENGANMVENSASDLANSASNTQ